ncbi:MAG TPA: hypothetical protein VJL29_08450 [Thermoguttaceae bacterium]|nr:hypothetical protein [Thermoguttaceae bacterium]
MRSVAKHIIRRVLGALGCEIYRVPRRSRRLFLKKPVMPAGAKLNVGCGRKTREGHLGCDVRPLETVDLVCRAWEVPDHCRNLAEIYSRHMLEHLALAEADYTLHQWFRALAVGGRVHVIVPYLPYHIEQYRRAVWSEDEWADGFSDARAGICGIFGWQSECDPTAANYGGNYWDVHKTGFDERLMTFLLGRAGFEEIQCTVEDRCHLVARAVRRRERCEPFVPLPRRKQAA